MKENGLGQSRHATEMTSLADDVACLILETYNSLPKVGKPSVRTNGLAEWTIIAGVVIKREGTESESGFSKI